MSGSKAATALDVLIVEEYVPEYRERFLELLERALAAESLRLGVAVGPLPAGLAARGDAVDLPVVRRVPARAVTIAGRRLTYRSVWGLAGESKLVVLDQGLRHLENYALLLRQLRGPRIALFGHGARVVRSATALESMAERRVTNLAHWFFAYTEGSAQRVAAGGYPRERITVVQNTVDVRRLAERRDSVTVEEELHVRAKLGLPDENVGLFVGALDASKRIDFLLQAASVLAQRVPNFTLVIAGDGLERPTVERSLHSSPWIRYVGRADAEQKARLGAVSDAMLMPGRVGLVAVDSFALRTPIVTTRWSYHAPEVEYLEDGVNARLSADTVEDFARVTERTLLARDELARMKAACSAARTRYSLETMVDNFTDGVVAALRTPRR